MARIWSPSSRRPSLFSVHIFSPGLRGFFARVAQNQNRGISQKKTEQDRKRCYGEDDIIPENQNNEAAATQNDGSASLCRSAAVHPESSLVRARGSCRTQGSNPVIIDASRAVTLSPPSSKPKRPAHRTSLPSPPGNVRITITALSGEAPLRIHQEFTLCRRKSSAVVVTKLTVTLFEF